MFHNVIFKIVNLVAIWIIGIFGWNLAIFPKKHISFKERYCIVSKYYVNESLW